MIILKKNFKKRNFFTKRMNLQTFFEMGRSQTINKRNEKYLTCSSIVLSFKNLNIHFLELAEN